MDTHPLTPRPVRWVSTTQTAPWQPRADLALAPVTAMPDVVVQLDNPQQAVEGFGACFNELGWLSLALLAPQDRESILRELFAPGVGGNFTICRMPLGANDFSRDWYSYDEVDGDFALRHFSIANDQATLIPFIRAALAHQPDLRLWASPWSPPTWMKTNRHYAMALPHPLQAGAENGLRPDQVGYEGTDLFIHEERYLRAYAAYFGRFIDAYREQGIRVGMVMPQNEFNSAQVFPSCTWTPEGLASLITYLGPEMARRDVELFFGTLERPDEQQAEVSLGNAGVSQYLQGVGVQWAGKGAVAALHRQHPHLRIYMSEQECGDGRNDWRYCRYTWSLMKHYFNNGACAYDYWNISLQQGEVSRWGWAQNSLVSVDPQAKTYVYNYEYYMLKHLSHFVQPGARVIKTASFNGYENQLAFRNPDGSLVLVMQNDMSVEMPVRLLIGESLFAPVLPPDSFNTFVIPPVS